MKEFLKKHQYYLIPVGICLIVQLKFIYDIAGFDTPATGTALIFETFVCFAWTGMFVITYAYKGITRKENRILNLLTSVGLIIPIIIAALADL